MAGALARQRNPHPPARAHRSLVRAPVAVFVASSLLAAFAFGVFNGAPVAGARHWAAAPLLAFSIVFAMGGLVALASGPGARRGR